MRVALCALWLGLAAGPAWALDYTSPDAAAGADYSKASQLVAAEKYDEAMPILQGILKKFPNHADALNLMGYSHRKKGDYTQAFAFYEKSLENNPLHRGANEYIGQAYLEQGDLANAERHLKILEKACRIPCVELDKLKISIDAFKNKGLNTTSPTTSG